ncbi:outer membrane protein [Thiogranum longum]|uniref:Outer membrane protein n=1 Tax=Thiogranum longum TaxID=1537524 RepID=A0A4R1HCL1_9GAMM|nr:TIGR04219 family outer membrane beta-barrel protein [Thiogranum longum]TCK18371.1 outer membrane protein [Thiogranum longum]
MRQLAIYAALLTFVSPFAQADNLKAEAGAQYWSYDIGGSVRYQSKRSSDDIDVNDDLGYNDDDLNSYYLSFEHPVPALPNVRVSFTNIDTSANGTLSKSVDYGNTTFAVNEDVNSELQLDQTDVTMYYQLFDTVLNVDLGLNAKYIDSRSRITGSASGTETADVSGWVPMLYAGFGADLPFTGLSISADGSFVGYQDSTFYDYTLKASYITPWYLGVDVGYRAVRLNLDDFDGSYADIEFDGPFAGAHLEF